MEVPPALEPLGNLKNLHEEGIIIEVETPVGIKNGILQVKPEMARNKPFPFRLRQDLIVQDLLELVLEVRQHLDPVQLVHLFLLVLRQLVNFCYFLE